MAGQLTTIGQPGALQSALGTVDEVTFPMTYGLLQEALQKAKDQTLAHARSQSTRELKQALDAQAAAKDEEREALVVKLRAEWEGHTVHRIRAARLWAGLVSFVTGSILAGVLVLALARGTLSAGSDIGIDAATKSRMIDEIITRGKEEPAPEEACDDDGCRPGQRAPNGATMRTREPASAP